MRREKRRVMIASFILTMLASVVSVFAQEAPPPPPKPPKGEGDVIMFERRIGPPPPGVGPQIEVLRQGQGPGETFVFVSTEMSFGHKIVKNAPYSAQATTETTQTLADGNRIVRKNTANVYRDSEGRTRHDQSLSSIGPWSSAGEPQQTSFIGDPVSRVHYILEPRTRIARKLPLPPHPPLPPGRVQGGPDARHDIKVRVVAPPSGAPDRAGVVVDETIDVEGGNDSTVVRTTDAQRAARIRKAQDNLRSESLGKQIIEGVEAEGTRETFTIPAGEIGNEQPIQIVSERWYSPALQTVVLTKHSDPRFGETTFRLTNINRSEPARSLFEVPADYTIKEGPAAPRVFRKKLNEEK